MSIVSFFMIHLHLVFHTRLSKLNNLYKSEIRTFGIKKVIYTGTSTSSLITPKVFTFSFADPDEKVLLKKTVITVAFGL